MELILKEDVANLGYKDDIVNVKRGYGRNYLIPTGKAVIATESARKVLAENLRQRAHKLAKLGHEIDRKTIVIKDAIKEVGTYTATVKLHKEVAASITLNVVAEAAAE